MTTQLEIRMNAIIDRYIINSFEKNHITLEFMFQEIIDERQTNEFIRSELKWWLIDEKEVEYDCYDKRNRDPSYDEDAENEEDEDAEVFFITLYRVEILEYYEENEKISGEEDLNEEELKKFIEYMETQQYDNWDTNKQMIELIKFNFKMLLDTYLTLRIIKLVEDEQFKEYLINLFDPVEPK